MILADGPTHPVREHDLGVREVAQQHPHRPPPDPGIRRVIYSGRARSKLARQIPLLLGRPDAVVIFEQDNDFPLLSGGVNIHIDRRQPGMCQTEAGGILPRLGFLGRWSITVLRTLWYAARLRPYVSPNKYG